MLSLITMAVVVLGVPVPGSTAAVVPGEEAREREPYLSVRTGLKCMNCHVNRTGGGARTLFGTSFGQTQLPAMTEGFEFRNRAINDWLNVGADVRVLAAAAISDATPQTSVEMQKANIMLEARLLRSLALYIDETVGPSRAAARELFGMIENLPLNGYAKFGKFLLPYGVRIVDDLEFVRDITGFSYLTPDQGVEVGIEPGEVSVFVSVTNGNNAAPESDDGKQITGSAAWITRRFRIGGSASHNDVGAARRRVFGGFGGFTAGPITMLGEIDRVSDRDGLGITRKQLVAYGEGNVLLRRGVNAKLTYGYHDRNTAVSEDQRIRVRLGLEVFPIPFFHASAFYTISDDIPQRSAFDQDRVSLEVHFYF